MSLTDSVASLQLQIPWGHFSLLGNLESLAGDWAGILQRHWEQLGTVGVKNMMNVSVVNLQLIKCQLEISLRVFVLPPAPRLRSRFWCGIPCCLALRRQSQGCSRSAGTLPSALPTSERIHGDQSLNSFLF